MPREYDYQVNVFECRRCGNNDPDKIVPVIEFLGSEPSGLIGHAKLSRWQRNGFRCLVCEPNGNPRK